MVGATPTGVDQLAQDDAGDLAGHNDQAGYLPGGVGRVAGQGLGDVVAGGGGGDLDGEADLAVDLNGQGDAGRSAIGSGSGGRSHGLFRNIG